MRTNPPRRIFKKRERLASRGGSVKNRHDGPQYSRHAKPVDSSGALPDGRAFKDVNELKALLRKDERQIARNLTQQLVIYSTSAPVRFADRQRVETILDRVKLSGYGVKSLIHGIIQSELFRNK